MKKQQRFPLTFGSETSGGWPGNQPLPVAKSYDFDPEASYPVIMDDEEAGHCTVERDFSGSLLVLPDFEIAFDESDVKFYAFWRVEGDKAMLASVLLAVRRTPTQPWVANR